MLAKLLAEDKPFVVILVGSRGCVKEVTNTIDTIESLQGISQKFKKPIACHYFENSEAIRDRLLSRTEIDTAIKFLVMHWALLLGEAVSSMDSKDIQNFIDYTKVTDHPASLTFLEVLSSDIYREEAGVLPMSMISVEGQNSSHDIQLADVSIPYHAVGVIAEGVEKKISSNLIRIINLQGVFPKIIKNLNKHLERLKAAESAAMVQVFSVNTDKLDDMGMKV